MCRIQTFKPLLLCVCFPLVLGACKSDDPAVPVESDQGNTTPGADAGADLPRPPAPDLALPDIELGPKPQINKIVPPDGFANGGRNGQTRVTLIGENFAPGMTAYIDGGQAIITAISYTSSVTVSFFVPKNPYGPPYNSQKVSIQVRTGSQGSNSVDFQYTVAEPMVEDFNAVVVTKDAKAFRDFRSQPIQATVYVKGVTDTTTGAAPNLLAQVGLGRVGDDPTQDYSFKWFPAAFVEDAGESDAFIGTVVPVLEQPFDIAYRFSTDDGKTWVYADTDGSPTAYAYDVNTAAKLTVSKAPNNYCTTNSECATGKYRKICLVDAANSDNNHCVECNTDADCAANKFALGPSCATENHFCVCAKPEDCAKNPNGKACVGAETGFCGCTKDEDCNWPQGEQCFEDQANNITMCQ